VSTVQGTTKYLRYVQLESKIIEPVLKKEWESRKVHFLLHHEIIREDEETIKFRIVFDDSAKSENCHQKLDKCLE